MNKKGKEEQKLSARTGTLSCTAKLRNKSVHLMGFCAVKGTAHVWRNLVVYSQHSPMKRKCGYTRGI